LRIAFLFEWTTSPGVVGVASLNRPSSLVMFSGLIRSRIWKLIDKRLRLLMRMIAIVKSTSSFSENTDVEARSKRK
jgi:hypothetical protein